MSCLKLIASEYSSVSMSFSIISSLELRRYFTCLNLHIFQSWNLIPLLHYKNCEKWHFAMKIFVTLLCCVTLRTNICDVSTIYDICGMIYAEVSTHACFPLHLLSSWWSGRADQIESRYRNSSKFIENYWHANMIKCMHLLI